MVAGGLVGFQSPEAGLVQGGLGRGPGRPLKASFRDALGFHEADAVEEVGPVRVKRHVVDGAGLVARALGEDNDGIVGARRADALFGR